MVKISEETNEVSKFVQNRTKSITEDRIKNILWYVVESYNILVQDNVHYSKNYVKNHTTFKFENYLRNRLVEDYLIKNKNILQQKMSELDEINFSYESEKEYTDLRDNKRKPDKIDIYINKLGLSGTWKEPDENVYFAIECKRIEGLSDGAKYIEDIEKFADRDYVNLRLPFEGQLAFIEDSSITHTQLYKEINSKLNKKETIITKKFLDYILLHTEYKGTYLSKHERNFDKRETFSIYHLLLNYSNIVVE
jgi:hypothetical protein